METVARSPQRNTAPPDPAGLHETVLEPPRGWLSLRLRERREFRELPYFRAWRDIRVRYKQAALGALWAIVGPFMTMVLFSVIFGRLAQLPSDGIPYPIFSYAALLPVFILLALVTAMAAGLWLSALTVRFATFATSRTS